MKLKKRKLSFALLTIFLLSLIHDLIPHVNYFATEYDCVIGVKKSAEQVHNEHIIAITNEHAHDIILDEEGNDFFSWIQCVLGELEHNPSENSDSKHNQKRITENIKTVTIAYVPVCSIQEQETPIFFIENRRCLYLSPSITRQKLRGPPQLS